MSVSSHSSGAGSRVGSPEDENGNSGSQLPASPTTAKQDRFADLKRRSAYAFSIFANEEREKLMKTHPDLPMGLVTRMMVEKWKGLDTEAKMPYFEAARTSPLKTKKPADAIPESIPSKKLRPIIPYTKISLPVNDQPIRVETVTEQQPGKVIFVQGVPRTSPLLRGQVKIVGTLNLSKGPQRNGNTYNQDEILTGRVPPAGDRAKIGYPSSISASIAHALGMPIAVQPRRRSPSVVTRVSPPPLRTAAVRPRPPATVAPAPQVAAAPVATPALPVDTEVRPQTTNRGFATSQQALDMFYLALCEPAFPHPNEPPLTPYPANYCYDEYLRMTSGQGPL